MGNFFKRHGPIKTAPAVVLPERHVDDLRKRPLFEQEPDRAMVVLNALKAGASPFTAMRCAGWGPTAYYTWKARAEASEEPYAAFFEQVYQAMAHARVMAEQVLTMKNPEAYLTRGPGRLAEIAGDGQWQADKGASVTVQTAVLNHPTAAPDLERLSVDELKALEAILAKACPIEQTEPANVPAIADGGPSEPPLP